MEEKIRDLEKRVAKLEKLVQVQHKEYKRKINLIDDNTTQAKEARKFIDKYLYNDK